MLIIFRRWGILGLLPLVGIGALTSFNVAAQWPYALMVVVASAANWFLGSWLNTTRAAQQADAQFDLHQRQVRQQVETGVWRPADGSMPTSLPQARAMADQELAADHQAFRRALRNRNTLFFIPLQYVGALGVVVGIVLLVVTLFQ